MSQVPKELELRSSSPFIDPFFMNATPSVFAVGDFTFRRVLQRLIMSLLSRFLPIPNVGA